MPTLTARQFQQVKDYIEVSKGYAEDKYRALKRPDEMRQWFTGDHFRAGSRTGWVNQRDRISVNLTQANVISKVSKLAARPPTLTVLPDNKEARDLCIVEKHLLEYSWLKAGGPQSAFEACFDLKILGTCGFATGWSYRTKTIEADVPEGGTEFAALAEQRPIANRPVIRVVKPGNLILDPDQTDIQKGWWIGEWIVRPLWQMRKMKQYKAVASKLRGDVDLTEPYISTRGRDRQPLASEDDHRRGVKIAVLYLRESLLRVEYTEEYGDGPIFVGDRPAIDYPADEDDLPYFPYTVIHNIPDAQGEREKSTHYGIPDVAITESQQVEINLSRSMLAAHRRMTVPLYATRKGALGNEDRQAISSGQYNRVVEIAEDQMMPGQRIREIIEPLERTQVNPEVYTSEDRSRRDFSELSRTSSYDRSMDTPGIGTATEAAMLNAGSQSGIAFEKGNWELGIANVIKQMASQLHRWGDESYPLELQLPGGVKQPADVSGQDVGSKGGRFRYIVVPDSMAAPNSMVDEQRWFSRMQAIAPFVQTGIDVGPILRMYLDSFDCPDSDQVIAGIDLTRRLNEAAQQMQEMQGAIKALSEEVIRLKGAQGAEQQPVEPGAPEGVQGPPGGPEGLPAELAPLVQGIGQQGGPQPGGP